MILCNIFLKIFSVVAIFFAIFHYARHCKLLQPCSNPIPQFFTVVHNSALSPDLISLKIFISFKSFYTQLINTMMLDVIHLTAGTNIVFFKLTIFSTNLITNIMYKINVALKILSIKIYTLSLSTDEIANFSNFPRNILFLFFFILR